MGVYNYATICTNGHVVNDSAYEYTPYCQTCGKETVSNCQKCETDIRGAYMTEYGYETDYRAPSYCFNCGEPFPWTKILLNNAIELIALDDQLPNDIKEIIKNALPDLIVETPSTPVATAKFRKFIPEAAQYIQDGLKNLLFDVASETVKKTIWG